MDKLIRLLKRYWMEIIGFLFVLASILLVSKPKIRAFMNTNQGSISLVLTAMLVILYFGQHRVQSRQLRFQNKPHVVIEKRETEGQKIEVWLSNYGNGAATNLEIETCINFNTTKDLIPGCASKKLRRVGENGDWKRCIGNSLKAGESNVKFVAEPITDITNKSSGGYGLRAATRRLAREDINEATLTFFITNSDLLGSGHREQIFSNLTVEFENNGVNISEMKRNTKRINGVEVL